MGGSAIELSVQVDDEMNITINVSTLGLYMALNIVLGFLAFIHRLIFSERDIFKYRDRL